MATIDYKQKIKDYMNSSDVDTLYKSMLNNLFPELKESEDERMRNAAINACKYMVDNFENSTKQYEDAIAWLEKQGEQQGVSLQINPSEYINDMGGNGCYLKNTTQKPAEEIEPTPIFRIGDILKRKDKDYTFRVDRIQGGYYHCDRNYGAFFPIEEQDNWELIEQNSAWGEEDEAIYYGVIETEQYMLDVVNGMKKFAVGNISIKEECTRELNWLKSLKDRVQPKQEWSEEDKKIIDNLVSQLCNLYARKLIKEETKNKYVDWLKSLRPQNTWKPSDEQMKTLGIINITGSITEPHEGEVMISLYNDLKKLKE